MNLIQWMIFIDWGSLLVEEDFLRQRRSGAGGAPGQRLEQSRVLLMCCSQKTHRVYFTRSAVMFKWGLQPSWGRLVGILGVFDDIFCFLHSARRQMSVWSWFCLGLRKSEENTGKREKLILFPETRTWMRLRMRMWLKPKWMKWLRRPCRLCRNQPAAAWRLSGCNI